MTEPHFSVVIPAYREGDSLRATARKVRKVMDGLSRRYEVIFIDDGSGDGTWEVMEGLAAESDVVRAFRFSRNFGKEAAICAGLEAARGRAVILMDADLQHPPSLIPAMVSLWEKGDVDIVEGVKRARPKESLWNRINAQLFYIVLNRLSGYDLQRASDFKLMDRKVVEAWKRMGERNVFFRGMSAWMGFRRAAVEFDVPRRRAGNSKWSFPRLFRLAVNAVTAFSTVPINLISILGGSVLFVSCVLAARALYQKLLGEAIGGFTTVIILLSFIGSILMIALGIVGHYVALIYEEVKGRPRYLIAESTAPESGGEPDKKR